MRDRTKSEKVPVTTATTYTIEFPPNGDGQWHVSSELPVGGWDWVSEAMTDDPVKEPVIRSPFARDIYRGWDENNVRRYTKGKPCTHIKYVIKDYGDSVNVFNGGGNLYYSTYVQGMQCYLERVGNAPLSIVPRTFDPPDWNEIISQFWNDVEGNIEPGLLSLATVGEIGTLKNLVGGFSEWLELIWHLPRRLRNTPLGALKDMVGIDLGYKFGIKPMIQDALAMVNIVDAVQGRLDHMAQWSGKDQKMRVKGSTRNSYEDSHYFENAFCVRNLTATVNASYDISDYQASRLVLQSLGIDRIASTFWELTPMSFVIDWFVRIGDLIGYLERMAFQTNNRGCTLAGISDVCFTEKLTSNHGFYFSPPDDLLNRKFFCGMTERTAFARAIGNPGDLALTMPPLQDGKLSASQVVTGIELGFQLGVR